MSGGSRSNMSDSRKITVHEVCGNTDLEEILDLGAHPRYDDLIPSSQLIDII